ncbi:MAG: nuclear transport factor 2 family protein [Saprospiraceae bacterium]|nr:nuclear transport factor 2 family protein [Saprospiraceae bacterium]
MKQLSMFSLLLCCALAQPLHSQDLAMATQNIRSAYDALSRKDWNAFATYCAPNYTDQNVGPAPTAGIQAAIGLYQQFAAGFPDFKVVPSEIVPAGPRRYFVRVTVSGTNTGSFMMLPPTGKSIWFEDTDIVELDNNGKCVSHAISRPGEPLRQIGYGSMALPSTQVVMAVYEKFGRGDVPGVLSLCDDQVQFDIQDRMFDTQARMFNGKAAVGQFFQELGSKFQYSKFQPLRFVADGEDVFILIDAEYTLAASGKKYASTYTHHFKVVNGKVTFFRGVDDFQQLK